VNRLRYALVTPARNERENLERLAAAVLAQRLEPSCWVIVDDASDDGTTDLALELEAQTPWIVAVTARQGDGTLDAGRRHGRALDAFRAGVRALPGAFDVVVKVDADTSFEPDYFDRLVARFEQDPELGIAGGACYELEEGEWVRQRVIATHPRGASRAYRWPCVEDVMTLESRMGWDGLDEVKARMRGYRSETVLDLPFRHHRATGGREKHPLRHQAAQGEASWYMGYRPSYLVLRVLYRSVRDPAAVGMLWGYARAAATRAERCPDRQVVRRLRDEQRLRRVVREGAPP
jgi:glycosyltransferase involved in cell wall biosynthesis